MTFSRSPLNFNPRAPYGARPETVKSLSTEKLISIHAPHTGRDANSWPYIVIGLNFNPRAPYGARLQLLHGVLNRDIISIHAPHTGRDLPVSRLHRYVLPFQSTRPIRGATHGLGDIFRGDGNFNPRAPYGARPPGLIPWRAWITISIHAPHTGRDSGMPGKSLNRSISIHAPHTGRDSKSSGGQISKDGFQSTRPIRGATVAPNAIRPMPMDFNPRAPYGARPFQAAASRQTTGISIHAPHTGRDVAPNAIRPMPMDFNPRAPYGARPCFSDGGRF